MDPEALHAKIGQLTLENDFLEGALTKAGIGVRYKVVWLAWLLALHTAASSNFQQACKSALGERTLVFGQHLDADFQR